jgi:hypothetical protein
MTHENIVVLYDAIDTQRQVRICFLANSLYFKALLSDGKRRRAKFAMLDQAKT